MAGSRAGRERSGGRKRCRTSLAAPRPDPHPFGRDTAAGGSAPQLWGCMALLLLEGRSGSRQAGAAQAGGGGAVSRVSGRARAGSPAGGAWEPPLSGRGGDGGGARPRGPAGAPSPRLCV
ncbi:unnamed protein product, partial [Coccothraustes coccothraustes]